MPKPNAHPLDPRDLIGEAYRIEGIGPEDCRSIFFDWALGLADGVEPRAAAETLLADLDPPEGHPMTSLLNEAADAKARPQGRRRRR